MFGSLKGVFPKCTFSGPQLNWKGLVRYLLNSSKAGASVLRGFDNENIKCYPNPYPAY